MQCCCRDRLDHGEDRKEGVAIHFPPSGFIRNPTPGIHNEFAVVRDCDLQANLTVFAESRFQWPVETLYLPLVLLVLL